MSINFKKYLLAFDTNLKLLEAEEDFYHYVGMKRLNYLDEVVPPQDMLLLKNTIFAVDFGGNTLSCFRIRTSSGTLNWIAANIRKADDGSGNILMELSDIQTLKSAGNSNTYDPMTGLLNKKTITDIAMDLTMRPDANFYFALADIDHFKRVNDTYGHKRGDEVIIEVAHTIRECIGKDGLVGRIGGDEFMIVMEHVHERPRLREILNNLRDTVEATYNKSEDDLHLTISVGVTLYPDYSVDYNELFSLTDKMLYRAKEKGRNRYVIYTPEIHAHIRGGADAELVSKHHIYTEKEKNRLIMELMSSFLMTDSTNIDVALSDVLTAYNMDEIHICYEGREQSHYGVRKKLTPEGDLSTELCSAAFPFIKDVPALNSLLNENNALWIATDNYIDLESSPVISYMKENKLRFIMVYHMTECRIPAYMVYMNYLNSICRPSETDLSDFLYFARMVELVLKTR